MDDRKIPERVLPERPETKPLERFWPYTTISEQPTDEELAKVQPELRDAIFGEERRPFSVTLIFPVFDGPNYPRAVAFAEAADDHVEYDRDGRHWHRARFATGDRPMRIRDLYLVVAPVPGNEVLINDRQIPYARELWLPLVWLLIR
jgi:hypothetical protein